jgi:CBS domain-containing protein
MKISEIPEFRDKSSILTMEENEPLLKAIDAMNERNVGAILVTKDGKLSGIFTERDLLRRVVGKRLDAEGLLLSDVMTSNPKTATVEDRVADTMRRMSQGRFRHMPIVGADGNLKGLLSQGDFVAFTWSDLFTRITNTTKQSFFANTQLWVLILAPLVYLLLFKLAF